jgi:hypothetical protein
MAPALALLGKYLLANGLPLVANAIMTKGKEVVEEKLGVKLEPNMTNEQLLSLKQREMEHQEFLISAAMEKQKLDLDDFRAEVGDKDSARKRDVEFIKSSMVNWRAHTMFIIACVGVAWLVYIVWTTSNIDEFTKGVVTLILGRCLGWLDNIYNFEFGTTRGSRSKDEVIRHLTE